MLAPPGKEVSEDEFDLLIALVQVLVSQPQLPTDRVDFVLDSLVDKIAAKGGARCDLNQIPDLAYEAQVGLFLEARAPGFGTIAREGKGQPDQWFRVTFSTCGKEEQIAIECKNVRKYHALLADQVRAVTVAILNAREQHRRRSTDDELAVFVDLPPQFMHRPVRDYEALVANVWNDLALQGADSLGPTNVFFTSTHQQEMARFLATLQEPQKNFVLMRPLAICANPWISAVRTLLVSMVFREDGQRANVFNWSQQAMLISDWRNLILE